MATSEEVHVFKPSDDQELIQTLKNLADSAKTSSHTSFKREFGLLRKKKRDPATSWAYLSEMMPVIQRCCSEKKFWPADELEFFISENCISARNMQMVFKTLAEKKEVGLLYKALKNRTTADVTETCLVIALQCFLSAEEEVFDKAVDQYRPPSISSKPEKESCPFSKSRIAFVDQVFEASYDEAYLVSRLKKLPFGLVLELLKYILYRLKSPYVTEPYTRGIDFHNKLIEWVGHLIDAHSSQLIISKDAHGLLFDLEKEVNIEIEYGNTCRELLPLLEMAMSKPNMGQGNTGQRAQYRIETLRL